MKLWLVVAIFGKVAATWGPLPYDIAECQVRASDRRAELDQTFAAGNLATDERARIDGRQITRADVTITCVTADKRPE